MRKIRVAGVALVVILISSGTLFAPPLNIIDTFYTDGTFTMWVGYIERDCSDNVTQVGPTTDWIMEERYGCNGGTHNIKCYHVVDNAWVEVQCP